MSAPATKFIATIAHMCLANAHRDERTETFRYGARHAQFLSFFRATNGDREGRPDVVSLKELRACKSPDGTNVMTAFDLVNAYASAGRYAIAACDPVKLTATKKCDTYEPFHLAQLYDTTRLVKLTAVTARNYKQVFGVEAEEDAPHFGACTLTVTYAPLIDGLPCHTSQFAVTTHHFHLDEQAKLNAAHAIAVDTGVSQSSEPAARSVHIGDFNLFRDGASYDKIRHELTRELFDATAQLQDQFGKPMYGTFFPFPHDKPPVPIARPEENSPNTSRLDYAFVSRNVTVRKAWVLRGMEVDGVPMSDHLPLFVQVAF